MKLFLTVATFISLLCAGCNKDKWVERTGVDDHPKGTTNLSGMDATGPAANRSQSTNR